MALEDFPAAAIGLEQALHQGRRQGRGGEQHAAAEQAGPVHQPRQGGQVVDIEVVDLVEHQVGSHQAEQWRYLVSAAQAFAGGHQVVDGAGQDGRLE